MQLTDSHLTVFPQDLLDRYGFYETRNASAMLQASSPDELDDLIQVLRAFRLSNAHLTTAGKNESSIAKDLNHEFRSRGWRETEVSSHIQYELKIKPWKPAGEKKATVVAFGSNAGQLARSYLIDNFKGRVASDVEWNAKDGNLARDLAAYRAYYDAGVIDAAVMVTREGASLRDFAQMHMRLFPSVKRAYA